MVELVSLDGAPLGSTTVELAHTSPGLLHRAFSVLLIDGAGQTLLQQRAAGKSRFPLRWANSCCGHPAPRESVVAAASRRLAQELGIRGVHLIEAGIYSYQAEDPASGLVETEFDHVLLGRVDKESIASPDPAEVAATRWTPIREALADASAESSTTHYAPWLCGVLDVACRSKVLSDLQ